MTPTTSAKLLSLAGWGFVAFGLVWETTAFAGMDAPGRFLIDLLDWPLDGGLADPSKEARWMGAIGAGLTVGIGLMLALIFAPLIKKGDPDVGGIIRKGGLIAFTAWLIVDSAGSIASGVPSNAVFNFIFYLLIAVPLWQVKFTK